MNKELRDKLIQAFPRTFPKDSILMHGDGWFNILFRLAEHIEPKLASDGNNITFFYAKEKFGDLSIHTIPFFDWMEVYVNKAEEESDATCEVCGEPGVGRSRNGWLYTACDKHARSEL